MVFLTDSEAAHVAANKDRQTVPEIARELKRGASTLYAYYKQKGWTPFVDPAARRRNEHHPFRRQNRKLEQFHIARRPAHGRPGVERNAGTGSN